MGCCLWGRTESDTTEATQQQQGINGASLTAPMVKKLPVMQETCVQFLGWEDSLEKGMTTYSSILENSMDRGAWRVTVHGIVKVGHD